VTAEKTICKKWGFDGDGNSACISWQTIPASTTTTTTAARFIGTSIRYDGRGRVIAASYAFLSDQLVRLAYDLVVQRLHPPAIPSAEDRISIVGLGGTGRGEMAPYSDLDLMFLINERTPWNEQAIGTLLYILWDLKLKVGQSVRTPDEVVAAAKDDMTIRTALREGRGLWGDEELHIESMRRFRAKVVAHTARDYVAAKLAEHAFVEVIDGEHAPAPAAARFEQDRFHPGGLQSIGCGQSGDAAADNGDRGRRLVLGECAPVENRRQRRRAGRGPG